MSENGQERKRFFSDLSSAVAHDLAAPLRNIDLFLEVLLEETPPTSPTARVAVDGVRRCLRQAETMTGHLAAALRLRDTDARQADQAIQPIIDDALAHVARLEWPGAPELIAHVAAPAEARAFVDARWLAFVVQELLLNAWRFAGAGAGDAPVEVSIEIAPPEAGGSASLRVVDSGPGLAELQRATALQPFTRFQTAPEGPSLGIGLWLCAEAMRAQGGGVRLDARPDGAAGLAAVIALPPVASV